MNLLVRLLEQEGTRLEAIEATPNDVDEIGQKVQDLVELITSLDPDICPLLIATLRGEITVIAFWAKAFIVQPDLKDDYRLDPLLELIKGDRGLTAQALNLLPSC